MDSPIEYLWYRLFPPPDSPLWKEREERRRQARLRSRRTGWYRLNEDLANAVHELAGRDECSEEDAVNRLVASGLVRRHEEDDYERCWATLTRREKQVAAMTCQGYTYQEIGLRLSISPATAKVHTHTAMSKFGLTHKGDLRRILAHWNFPPADPEP